jgi:hypothetical protein
MLLFPNIVKSAEEAETGRSATRHMEGSSWMQGGTVGTIACPAIMAVLRLLPSFTGSLFVMLVAQKYDPADSNTCRS